MKLISLLLMALFVAIFTSGVAALEVGEVAPEFTLPNVVTGEQVSLSDYAGKVVILIFFHHD